ncbi:MAG: hypothetical protein AAB692_03945 [Patescibacteria group bacterium]
MKGKRLFLQWALFMSLIGVAAIIGLSLGGLAIFREEPTHISLITLSVFFLATVWCGRLAWKLSGGHDPQDIVHELDHGWFASSLCVSIGLIGTAIGYYMMLKHGAVGAEGRTAMFANTSIAVINTFFGAICGVIVEIQSHFIGHAAAKAVRAAGKKAEEP